MRTLLRIPLLVASFLISGLVHAQTPPGAIQATEITIAVRMDARPFIWKDPNTNEYLGFFWDICTEAVNRADYKFQTVKIDAEGRRKFLQTGAGDFDLLCDPTTITLKRIQNFIDTGGAPDLEFTSIIFVANASFVAQEGRQGTVTEKSGVPCNAIFERLRKATTDKKADDKEAADTEKSADPWFTLSKKEEVSENKEFQVWGYIDGSTIGESLEDWIKKRPTEETTIYCLRPLASHEEAADEFCSGRLARYFGDVEIVRATLADYRERTGKACPADLRPTEHGTYEPYALVVSSQKHTELPERIALALYGMFEDGTVERLFAGHFPDTEKSQFLSTLFRINSIPSGRDVSAPSAVGRASK
jgi:ABC-type amino acid transport substrate-binding protein